MKMVNLMKTLVLKKEDVTEIVSILNRGGIVALPTDTVYGLAIKAGHLEAVSKLIKVKNRPESKPFILMVSAKNQISEYASLKRRDQKLIKRWMPGAMTFIFNKKNAILGDGNATVAIRMPDDPWLINIIRKTGPLYVPGANLSGEKVALTTEEVMQMFEGKIDAVVNGVSGDIKSTIIDATSGKLILIREGPIGLREVETSVTDGGKMKIALAADHGGFAHKELLKEKLIEWGYEVEDFGTQGEDSVDYSDFVYPAAKAVSEGRADKGIIFCGTGIGASITANKVNGIRCALVNDVTVAEVTRLHNDSNVLAMGGRVISEDTMLKVASVWLNTPFSEDARHQRRIHKIAEIEKAEDK
jgi:ribose 5-phosphate isomerase B